MPLMNISILVVPQTKAKCDVIVKKYGWPMNNWLVGNVTNMSYLFANSSLLLDDNISGWDVSSVTSMDGMESLGYSIALPCTILSVQYKVF